jgi:hypothetical protein
LRTGSQLPESQSYFLFWLQKNPKFLTQTSSLESGKSSP